MIVFWESAQARTLNYCMKSHPGEKEALLVHDLSNESFTDAHAFDEETKNLIRNTPQELLDLIVPPSNVSIFSSKNALKDLGINLRTFETHSEILSYYMGDPVDPSFIARKDAWVRGLTDFLKASITRSEMSLVVLPGRTFDPLFFYIQQLITIFGVRRVRSRLCYESRIGGVDRLHDVPLPSVGNQNLNLTDPDQMMLLLIHFLTHPSIRSDRAHPTINVARIANRLQLSGLSNLIPPKRGTERSYYGIYKTLKKISENMVVNGLLESDSRRRRDNFRLTPLGHAYANLSLTCKDLFDGPSKAILQSATLIQETPW